MIVGFSMPGVSDVVLPSKRTSEPAVKEIIFLWWKSFSVLSAAALRLCLMPFLKDP
jgi:hypothetical protein